MPVFSETPSEIIRRILLFTLPSDGPPTAMYSLRLTCRRIKYALEQGKADLYTRIFALQFDLDPPFRRLGYDRSLMSRNVQVELRRRFQILKDFRYGRLHHDVLGEALWTLYFMLVEDAGNNVRQIRWANAHVALQIFIRKRLYVGAELNHGWPLENHENSLAIACLWLSSSKSVIQQETTKERGDIMDCLRPIVQAAFRYPCFSKPEISFEDADHETPLSLMIHGPYPPHCPLSHTVPFFGSLTRKCHAPRMSLFAIPSYFARADVIPLAIPPHLPVNRACALATNRDGPTREDMQYFIDHCNTRFAVSESFHRSGLEHESEWLRLSGQQSYALGSLTGHWKGSMMVPCIDYTYKTWLSELQMPTPFPAFGRRPLSFILQEYYCTHESPRIPVDDPTNGIMNAWLPAGCKWVEQEDGIEVFDEGGSFHSFYKPFKPGGDKMANVTDVIVTGRPDEAHKVAWGGFNLFGRIRLSDGLAVLGGQALEVINPSIFRGYVISSQNFVGRSRGQLTSGFEPASWEAAFSLSKHTTQ